VEIFVDYFPLDGGSAVREMFLQSRLTHQDTWYGLGGSPNWQPLSYSGTDLIAIWTGIMFWNVAT